MLQRYVFGVLAFLIPFGVRSVPEVLSWPYPIGFDTVGYIARIQDGWVFTLSPLAFLKGTNLFYLVGSLSSGAFGSAVVLMKLLGPIMLGVLCFMMYLYARKALRWDNWKSLLVAVLIATYFVALRNSGDLYRQSLGLIFLMAALISLKSFSSPRLRYLVVGAFSVLTVMSHELAAVTLFFVMGFEGGRLLVKQSQREFGFLTAAAVVPLALFLFQRYSPTSGGLNVPLGNVASAASAGLAFYIGGSLVYCYVFILPLLAVGLARLKDPALVSWVVLGFGIVILQMFNPVSPFYIWYRWVLLLVYPLAFFAVQGLDGLWKVSLRFKVRIKRWILKSLLLIYLFSLIALGGCYLATSPTSPFPYFSQYNPYLTAIPSSMLQNTISIEDTPSLVHCANWLNQNSSADSLIVVHHGLYDLTSIYVRDRNVVHVSEDLSVWSNVQNSSGVVDKMIDAAKTALIDGHSAVYTVWWVDGKGWYQIPSLPSNFKEIYRAGDMGVYVYDPRF